jgi:hypothetical protein
MRRSSKDCEEASRKVTQSELLKFAKALGRESKFEADQRLSAFPAALSNYHAALWKWVGMLTPGRVVESLRIHSFYPQPQQAGTLPEDMRRTHVYLFRRAIFLSGMKTGEGFKAGHYRFFADCFWIADQLGDEEVFEAARQHRYGRKPKTGHETARRLKYALIVSWLAGGLWRMASREEQILALHGFWPDAPRSSPDAVLKAQKRLGLGWPI